MLANFPSGTEKTFFIREVGNSEEKFNVLLELALYEKDPLAWRAAWILDGSDEHCPGLALHHISRIVQHLPVLESNSTLRSLLRLLCRYDIPEDDQGLLIDRCFSYMVSELYPVAVKVHAMQIIYNHVRLYPELKDELRMVIEDQAENNTVGFKARGKRIMQQLENLTGQQTVPRPEIHFILYKPAVPGNVGAAARAIKTMGFSHLRLIDPCDHLGKEALMLAHGAREILESARVFSSFEEAVADLDLVVSTTAKGRSAKYDYHSSRELLSLLENKQPHLGKTGILFGTEESGLPNQLILQSDLAMSIPMAIEYPSINLAQSVMITAYELSPLNQLAKPGKLLSKSGEGWGELKNQARQLLVDTGIPAGSPLFHRIMERMATLGVNDIPLFLSVIKKINNTL